MKDNSLINNDNIVLSKGQFKLSKSFIPTLSEDKFDIQKI